jgi:thymidine phosphorylase
VDGKVDPSASSQSIMRARRLGLESQSEPVVILHKDCPICRSEGFRARSRIELRHGAHSVIATLYQVGDGYIGVHDAGLSEAAWRKLQVAEGDPLEAAHPQALESLSAVRAKLYGRRLSRRQLSDVIRDVTEERYSEVELAAFVAAFAAQPFDLDETVALTEAMIAAGERIEWATAHVADKHSVGGLPGNRTTPIVVAIAAAAGLTIPKTSSRAITSPAGTADVVETMTRVELDLDQIKDVVDRWGGCLAWGGSVRLSPADDIIIRVERALDVDCEAQLIASVLSKKIAAGATHVLLDIPVGPTAKVRSTAAAESLADNLVAVGSRLGLIVRPHLSDGSQPVGRGIGPALEARDVLAVLRNVPDAPDDLRKKSITLAARLMALVTDASQVDATAQATSILESGAAWSRFLAICEAQGGFTEPPVAPLTEPVVTRESGRVTSIDNRLVAKAAKLAGAPAARSAGMHLNVRLGDTVLEGDTLFTLHAETTGELNYALAYVYANPEMIGISEL